MKSAAGEAEACQKSRSRRAALCEPESDVPEEEWLDEESLE